MATIADYRVIEKSRTNPIGINDEVTLSFSLPDRVEFVNGPQQPIMAFRYNPSSANNLRLEVSVNGEHIINISNINSNTPISFSEPFNGDILNAVDDNIVTFRVEGDSGNITIAAVYILFQRSGFN